MFETRGAGTPVGLSQLLVRRGNWRLPKPAMVFLSLVPLVLAQIGCDSWGYEGREPYQPELMTPSSDVPRLQACEPSEWSDADPALVADGLDVPWDLQILSDGRMLVSERSGTIRLIRDGVLQEDPWSVVGGPSEEENGLMGLAYLPATDSDPGFVYVMRTVSADAPTPDGAKSPGPVEDPETANRRRRPDSRNQILRIPDHGSTGGTPEVIVDGIPADLIHAGGGLAFGPDGFLYAGVGEALGWSGPARNGLGPLWASSIHRYTSDGSVPADNPDPTNAVWAVGLRNPQAFGWHPTNGVMFTTDHGPSNLEWESGMFGRDELNVVHPGADYGWPSVSGDGSGGGFEWPLWHVDGLVPGGLAFVSSGTAEPQLFVSGLKGVRLVRVELGWESADEPPSEVRCQEELLVGQVGRIRALTAGEDGTLYFTTTNGDGRGTPDPTGDRVYSLRPPS